MVELGRLLICCAPYGAPRVRIPHLPQNIPTVFIYMWEYKRLVTCCQTPDKIIQMLNELGKEGWEVIQYVEENTATGHKDSDANYFILLKRQINSNKKVL